jgi:hypothetical protein
MNLHVQPYQLNAERGQIWVKIWNNIATKLTAFIYILFFSFLSSFSRPLETLKLWFLPSRPSLRGGVPKEKTKKYKVFFEGGDPPAPQTLGNQL